MRSASEAIGALLSPKRIAIVGASNSDTKPGGRMVKYLLRHGYSGELLLVNPKESEIAGRRCYARLSDCPGEVDLAALIVPATALMDVLSDCEAKGVKAVLVNASGFAEAGEAGRKLQDELVARARAGNFRICGPNSIGVFNPADGCCVGFSPALEMDLVPGGSIAFVTQSGALGGSILSRAWEQGIGFSRCISSGNEADLDTADFIEYLVEDPSTSVITLFLEGVSDGEKFRRALAMAAGRKPVVVFKNGRTEVGARSVQSHTGTLAGADEVYSALFKQYGIIRVSEVEGLFDAALALAWQPLPAGNRMGIVSTSGGACTIVADTCLDQGMAVPDFSPETAQWLERIIPSYGSARNPVDVTAQIGTDPASFAKSLDVVMEDPNVDGLLVMLTTIAEPLATELAAEIVQLASRSSKPLVVVWTVAPTLAPNGMRLLLENRIPLYSMPERAVRSMGALVRYSQFLNQRAKMKAAQEGVPR